MEHMANIIGKKFGILIVKEFSHIKSHRSYYVCKCDCGKEKVIARQNLVSGRTKSCGCIKKSNALTHGQSQTRIYNIWKNIRKRCNNPNYTYYNNYGG